MRTENIPPGELPVKNRVVTDHICSFFSKPIFLSILFVFLLVVIFGNQFSFLHPPDSKGFRCGLDNSKFTGSVNNSDFRNKSILSYSQECISFCDGKLFFSLCIPSKKSHLKKSSLPFKVASDFYQYWKFALFLIVISLTLSFPIYFACAKLTCFFTVLQCIFVMSFAAFSLHRSISQRSHLISALVLLFAISSLVFFFFIKTKLQVIFPVISESFHIFSKSRTVLFAPLFILSSSSALLLLVALGLLFSSGVGVPVFDSGNIRLQRHSSLFATFLLFALLGLWMLLFVVHLARASVSLAASSAFFHQSVPSFWSAMRVILRFHSGTLLFGSFALLLLGNVSALLLFLRRSLSGARSSFARASCRCLLSLCACAARVAGEVNSLAFVFTAMKGTSFWDSCGEAAAALRIVSVLSVEATLKSLFFRAKVLVTAFAAIAMWLRTRGMGLAAPSVPVLAVALAVYAGTEAVGAGLAASCETTLMCLYEDALGGCVHSPQNLMDLTEWIRDKIGKDEFAV